jgi:hypothetical protein
MHCGVVGRAVKVGNWALSMPFDGTSTLRHASTTQDETSKMSKYGPSAIKDSIACFSGQNHVMWEIAMWF